MAPVATQPDVLHPEFAKLNMADVEKAKQANKKTIVPSHPLDTIEHRFVGDVDLPESQEPLLMENPRRFVLFPIRFNEVRATLGARSTQAHTRAGSARYVPQGGACKCSDLYFSA